jgi:hypothetical protein
LLGIGTVRCLVARRQGELDVSDEYPVDDPGHAAPTWLALPTMPWTRVVPGQRSPDEEELAAQPAVETRNRVEAPPAVERRERQPHPDSQLKGWFESANPSESAASDEKPVTVPESTGPAWAAAAMGATSLLPVVPRRGGAPVRAPLPDDPTNRPTGTAPVDPSQATRPHGPGGSQPGWEPSPRRPDIPATRRPETRGDPTAADSIVEPTVEPLVEYVGPDPEELLASFEWRFDPETLREVVDESEAERLREIRELLTRKVNSVADNPTRARLLSLRAIVSRILGDLHNALADGKLAVAHAEATGELRRIAIAQARLAHVLQWTGEFEEADRLFALANSTELPDRLRATMHQNAGRCAYDQGRNMEACTHFELAVELRRQEDPDLMEQTALALDAVFRRVEKQGWGPYPRAREEILKIRKPPMPGYDNTLQCWGFLSPSGGPAGEYVIKPRYTDVQPFRDGVAWVQRPGSQNWELIDEVGESLIEPTAGYLGVSSFSDGLAWVSRDGATRWIAIDKTNNVLISTGFDDVRPFRRGIAAVRRGAEWGAVDGVGRVVVQFQYDGFATAMHDGRYIDGFNEEGLAVVSLDQRKGVVNRAGRVVVAPVYPVLVIHPVAFLIRDERERWGALDRRGRPLIDVAFPTRTLVVEELDRLLADTRPML